jgi:hypothetical protein
VKAAFPELSVPVPSVVVPFLNVTDPVGVPPVEVTVAVKVTVAPNVDGFRDEASDVELAACFTVCVSAGEALPPKFVSPP